MIQRSCTSLVSLSADLLYLQFSRWHWAARQRARTRTRSASCAKNTGCFREAGWRGSAERQSFFPLVMRGLLLYIRRCERSGAGVTQEHRQHATARLLRSQGNKPVRPAAAHWGDPRTQRPLDTHWETGELPGHSYSHVIGLGLHVEQGVEISTPCSTWSPSPITCEYM